MILNHSLLVWNLLLKMNIKLLMRQVMLGMCLIWLVSVWLFFLGLPNLINFIFGENLGLLIVPSIAIFNMGILLACVSYTYRKKLWWWFWGYLISGGIPLGLFFLGLVFG